MGVNWSGSSPVSSSKSKAFGPTGAARGTGKWELAGESSLPDPRSPRLILVLPGDESNDSVARRNRYLRQALKVSLESVDFHIEHLRLSPTISKDGKSSVSREAWALGLDTRRLQHLAEAEELAKQTIFRCQTPEGLQRTFARWGPFRRAGSQIHGFTADEAEVRFEPAEVLGMLRTRAYQATMPQGRILAKWEEDFKALEHLGQRHSVLALAQHAGVVAEVTTLHDDECHRALRKKWPRLWQGLSNLPLVDVVNYFGISTGQYFLFVHEYMCWLCVPALLGIAVKVWHSLSSNSDPVSASPVASGFMVVTAVWSTLFIEHWKRKRSGLNHMCGQTGQGPGRAAAAAPAVFQLGPGIIERASRPGAQVEDVPGKGSAEASATAEERSERSDGLKGALPVLRFLRTVPMMCCLFAVVSAVISVLLWIGEVAEKSYESVVLQNLPVLLYLAVAFYLERLYLRAAVFLTGLEAHASYVGYLKALTAKEAFFQLVNYLGWFVYLAFWMQDLTYLRGQLLIFMTVKQAFALCQETVIPVLCGRYIKRPKAPKPDPAAVPKTQESPPQRHTLHEILTQNAAGEVAGTEMTQRQRRFTIGPAPGSPVSPVPPVMPTPTPSRRFRKSEGESKELVAACELQLETEKVDLSFEYLQLAVLFALTNFFSAAFPLGPVLAFLHVFISRWSDGYKLLEVNRRILPGPEKEVVSDAWLEIFEAISMGSVVANVAVLGVADSGWTPLQLVALEHGLLLFKAYLAWSIPDQPEWVVREEAAFEQLRRFHGARQLQDRLQPE